MKVAIVTDWLTNMGGAERVVLSLHRLYPDAPIYTSTFEPEKMPLFKDATVHTAWFQRLPSFLRKHQLLTLPRQWYFDHLKLKGYDVVISCSGAEAKAVKAVNTLHVNYCHTPTQYYWIRPDEYLNKNGGVGGPILRLGLKLLMPYARKWDLRASTRPDLFIANSKAIQKRITDIYGRDSIVIHPPVEVGRFKPVGHTVRKGFIAGGRLVHHKRIDLAIAACNELQLPLTVIGEGPERANLEAMAGPTVKFAGFVNDDRMPKYFQSAEAYLFPNEEDFGVIAVEAMAAGCPVIAFKAGGALDYVVENITGTFFEDQSASGLIRAIKSSKSRHFSSDRIVMHAQGFSEERFSALISELLERESHKYKRRNA